MKKLTLENIVSDIVVELKKTKGKFILVDDFPQFLTNMINEKYGKFTYKSEVGIAVKNVLREHKEIQTFRPSDKVFDSNGAFSLSNGEYFVLKGYYSDVVEMKEKNKIVPMLFKRREDVVAWENGKIDLDEY